MGALRTSGFALHIEPDRGEAGTDFGSRPGAGSSSGPPSASGRSQISWGGSHLVAGLGWRNEAIRRTAVPIQVTVHSAANIALAVSILLWLTQ